MSLDEQPMIKVIKTIIYGVKCSGNQAERALRLVVEELRDKYPAAYEIVIQLIWPKGQESTRSSVTPYKLWQLRC